MLNPKLGVVGERWHGICPHCHDPVYRGVFTEGRWWHKHCWKDHRDKADIGYQGRMVLEPNPHVSDPWLAKAARAMGIKEPIKLEWSSSTKHWPDIWIEGNTITVTREWLRQNLKNRHVRLTHELLHLKGLKHGWKGKLLYSTHPEKDTFSRAYYDKLIQRMETKKNPVRRSESSLPTLLILGGLAFAGWWIYSKVRSSP